MTAPDAPRSLGKALSHALASGAAVLVLAGCHHLVPKALTARDCNKPQPYDRAQSIAPLRMPPGIDPPDSHVTLRIPALNEPAPPPRKLTDPCLYDPPPYFTPRPPAAKPVPAT